MMQVNLGVTKASIFLIPTFLRLMQVVDASPVNVSSLLPTIDTITNQTISEWMPPSSEFRATTSTQENQDIVKKGSQLESGITFIDNEDSSIVTPTESKTKKLDCNRQYLLNITINVCDQYMLPTLNNTGDSLLQYQQNIHNYDTSSYFVHIEELIIDGFTQATCKLEHTVVSHMKNFPLAFDKKDFVVHADRMVMNRKTVVGMSINHRLLVADTYENTLIVSLSKLQSDGGHTDDDYEADDDYTDDIDTSNQILTQKAMIIPRDQEVPIISLDILYESTSDFLITRSHHAMMNIEEDETQTPDDNDTSKIFLFISAFAVFALVYVYVVDYLTKSNEPILNILPQYIIQFMKSSFTNEHHHIFLSDEDNIHPEENKNDSDEGDSITIPTASRLVSPSVFDERIIRQNGQSRTTYSVSGEDDSSSIVSPPRTVTRKYNSYLWTSSCINHRQETDSYQSSYQGQQTATSSQEPNRSENITLGSAARNPEELLKTNCASNEASSEELHRLSLLVMNHSLPSTQSNTSNLRNNDEPQGGNRQDTSRAPTPTIDETHDSEKNSGKLFENMEGSNNVAKGTNDIISSAIKSNLSHSFHLLNDDICELQQDSQISSQSIQGGKASENNVLDDHLFENPDSSNLEATSSNFSHTPYDNKLGHNQQCMTSSVLVDYIPSAALVQASQAIQTPIPWVFDIDKEIKEEGLNLKQHSIIQSFLSTASTKRKRGRNGLNDVVELVPRNIMVPRENSIIENEKYSNSFLKENCDFDISTTSKKRKTII